MMRSGSAGSHVTAWSAGIAPVNTRAIEMPAPALGISDIFGRASIRGAIPGETVAIPTATFAIANFEGVVMNSFLGESDMSGGYNIGDRSVIGVCRHGDVFVQVPESATPAYGDSVHILFAGENAGKFSTDGGVTLQGAMFIGAKNDEGIAPIEMRRG